MTRSGLDRRLQRLATAAFPKNELDARIARLHSEHRIVFDRYRERFGGWLSGFPQDGSAYAAFLNGEMPELRSDVARALDGPLPIITVETSEAQSAEIYSRVKDDYS